MRRFVVLAIAGVGMVWFSLPVHGHHAFSAEFDSEKPIKFEGTVTEVEWINPHTWLHIDVKQPDGKVETWMIEGGTPNTLYRRGISKNSLKPGAVIVVDGFQAKDGTMRGNGRNLTLPDGRTLFMGSTGTGAPEDGKDPEDGRGRGRGRSGQ